MKNILIIGATSAIAEAVARKLAARGGRFYLLARNRERLAALAADLAVRGAKAVEVSPFDAIDTASHPACLEKAHAWLGAIDIALIAHGTLGDQQKSERNAESALREMQTNAISTISILTRLANIMEALGHGTIAVISSVAGDRGRPSNYVYGSAKAAVTAFCEGLRARLHKSGVHVLTIKPGIVDTPMTEGIEAPEILRADPDTVAQDIVRAIDRKKDTLYTPWYWKYIMMGIVHLPGSVFKKITI
jgi:decaprenylphospho-beta-D-erythro-pentofuranosid-2-ulose 2-reductase